MLIPLRPPFYVPYAVDFDGTNDYLTRGADLTGISDGKVGNVSFWIRMQGGDGVDNRIMATASTSPRFTISRVGGNTLTVLARNSAGTTILNMTSTASLVVASGWVNVMASWDLAVPVAQLYFGNTSVKAGGSTETNDTIDYTQGEWSFGAFPDGTFKCDAYFSDVRFTTTFIDLSVASNRAKFRDPHGKPVYLGTGGNRNGLVTPLLFFSGPASGWATNKGTGGGFTTTGTLTEVNGPNG